MKLLITGVSGFVGGHLAEVLCADPRFEVWGCDRSSQPRPHYPPGLRVLQVNLLDAEATRAMLEQVQPDGVFHLAGQAFVGASWQDPWGTLEMNVRAQLNLFEGLRHLGLRPRVLVPGSMEEYGRIDPAALPLREDAPLRPDSPYGLSKVTQDLMAQQYFLSHQIPVIRARPFNHIGPRQDPRFVVPAFASQIAAIEAGLQPPVMKVGNLSARRDFTDVRDMVRAYALALQHAHPGEAYNIGYGVSHSIQEVLDGLLALSAVRVTVEIDPARLRPVDVPDVVADAGKFCAHTGWQPQFTLAETLRAVLDFERARLNLSTKEMN